jgi:hypothetical protein
LQLSCQQRFERPVSWLGVIAVYAALTAYATRSVLFRLLDRIGAQEEASETTGGSSWSRWKGIQPPNPKASRLAVTHGEGFLRNRWWA